MKVAGVYPVFILSFILPVLFLPAGVVFSAESGTIPVEDFFRKPERENFRLSPDGLSVSYLAPVHGRMNLHVQRAEGGFPRILTAFSDRDLSFQLWKTNQLLLFGKDTHGDEGYHLYKVHSDGNSLTDLTPFDGCRATLLDELPDDPEHVLITLSQRLQEMADVYRLELRTGTMERVAENTGRIVDWLADHAGRVRIAVEINGTRTCILHRSSDRGDFAPVLETEIDDTLKPLLFTFDNRNLYAASNVGRDKLALVVIDLDRGLETKVLFEHDQFDVQALNHSRRRKVLTDVTTIDWKLRSISLDSVSRRLHEKWLNRFGGCDVELVEFDADEKTALLKTSSDRSRGTYSLYRVETDEMITLAEVSPWLDASRLRPMTPISLAARDGLVLHGYLTLPHVDPPARLPTVVKVHGGPWQRDRWGYDPEVQFLAERGYAVLQLNFRGSTGYGKQFWKASFKQWGRRMQDDLSDGVQWLVDRGIADPARIAIYGASYGGYAALAGLAFTPKLYACGIGVSAPTDLCRLLDQVPARWKPMAPSLHRMVGDPLVDREQLESTSPARRPETIDVPVMMAHGKRDLRVSYEDSLVLVNSLRARNIPVEWVLFENEGHWISNEENRIQFFCRLEAFLDERLKRDRSSSRR